VSKPEPRSNPNELSSSELLVWVVPMFGDVLCDLFRMLGLMDDNLEQVMETCKCGVQHRSQTGQNGQNNEEG
jgi:hypothetical protein